MTKAVALGMASVADELHPIDSALRPGLELSGQQTRRGTLARVGAFGSTRRQVEASAGRRSAICGRE